MRGPGIIATLAAALLIAGAPPAAEALDLGKTVSKTVGGVSKTVSKTVGGVSKTVGGLTGGGKSSSNSSASVASVGAGAGAKGGLGVSAKSSLLGGTSVKVDLLGKDDLADVEVKSGETGARIGVLSRGQLAALKLDSDPAARPGGGGSGESAAVTPDYARALLADLDRIERQALKLRCRDVLRSPKAFDAELILLCQIIAEL